MPESKREKKSQVVTQRGNQVVKEKAGQGNIVFPFIGIPTNGKIDYQTCAWLNLVAGAHKAAISYSRGSPCCRMRNHLVRKFLDMELTINDKKGKATHLVFLDDDIVPPPDGLEQMAALAKPVVTAPCPLNLQGNIVCNVQPADFTPTDDKPWPELWPSGVFKVHRSGFGFVMIERWVLEKLEWPWFQYTDTPDGFYTGHDVYFFDKLREAGIDVWCDSNIRCEHLKGGVPISETHRISVLRQPPAQRLEAPNIISPHHPSEDIKVGEEADAAMLADYDEYFVAFDKVASEELKKKLIEYDKDYKSGKPGVMNASPQAMKQFAIYVAQNSNGDKQRILNAGSGVSSFILRKCFDDVVDKDLDTSYRLAVEEACKDLGLEGCPVITLGFDPDWTFYDLGNILVDGGGTRREHFHDVFEGTKRGMYVDDLQFTSYRSFVEGYAKARGLKLVPMPETMDEHGRYGAMLLKD